MRILSAIYSMEDGSEKEVHLNEITPRIYEKELFLYLSLDFKKCDSIESRVLRRSVKAAAQSMQLFSLFNTLRLLFMHNKIDGLENYSYRED